MRDEDIDRRLIRAFVSQSTIDEVARKEAEVDAEVDAADREWRIEQVLTEALRDALPGTWPLPVTAAFRLRVALEREGLLR